MGHRSNSCRFSGHFVEIPGFAKNSEPSGGEPTPSHHENLLENPFSYPRLQSALHHEVDFHSQGFREPELEIHGLYESYGPFELYEDIEVTLWVSSPRTKEPKTPMVLTPYSLWRRGLRALSFSVTSIRVGVSLFMVRVLLYHLFPATSLVVTVNSARVFVHARVSGKDIRLLRKRKDNLAVAPALCHCERSEAVRRHFSPLRAKRSNLRLLRQTKERGSQ